MLGGGVKSTKEQEEWAAGTKYPQSLLHGSLKCHRKFFFGWLQDISSKVWKVGPRSHDTRRQCSHYQPKWKTIFPDPEITKWHFKELFGFNDNDLFSSNFSEPPTLSLHM